MCCEPYVPGNEDDVHLGFRCEECDSLVDREGDCIEECCGYSPKVCEKCGWAPCDGSC